MSITFLFDFTKIWSEILIAYTKPCPICLPSFTSLRSVTFGSEGSGEASGEALSYSERKELQKKIRKTQRAVDESEAKIAKLEARKSELDELLMAPENASNMELVTEYTNLQRELDEENERWLILSEELETLNIEL